MTKSNFGRYGWYLIIFSGLLFFLQTGLSADGQNIYVPAFAEKNGWDSATLLGFASVAGYISIGATVVMGWLIGKKGARAVMTASLFVSGGAMIFWGRADEPGEYFLSICLILLFTNVFSHLSASTVMDSFFPKKKGLALGWATMGLNLSAAGAVPLLSLLLGAFGLTKAFTLIGVVLLVCGAVCAVTIRNAPEELGLSPDNEPLTKDQIEESRQELDGYRSPWRMVDFLKVRETWCVGLAFGIQYLCAIGILSQFVPRTVSLGYEQDEAILMMSVSALVGLFGSYFWGWLDMKLGIRKASITIMCWYTVATALFVAPYSKPTLILGVAMLCFAVGGTASLAASYIGTVFGRHEFGRVFGLVNPITAAVRVSAWALLSFGLSRFGDYTPVYTIFLFCAIGGIALICCARDGFQASPGSGASSQDNRQSAQ